MSNQTQDSLSSSQSSYLETILDPFDGSSKLLSTISSANFNGAIPDLIIQYPDAVTDDLIPGRFFLISDTYYLITRVDENIDPVTTDAISYNVWYTSGGVERYKTILDGVKIFTDGTELQIRKDDWTNKSIGDLGWTITTEGNAIFSNVAVRGTIEATAGYFDGFLVIGDPNDPEYPGSMKIGTNVNSTNDGIYINEHNYWYDSGLFKIGNATKNVTWNNTNLAVTGDINATGGIFTGKVRIGDMYLGVDASPSLEDGIYIDATNYWYDDGNFSLGTGTNTISFNGSNIVVGTGVQIAGEISANSLLLTSGAFSMSIKANHNPISTSQRTITKVILSGTSPQLAEITTSTAHPFVAGDFIYISGLSNSGGGLGSLNKVFQVSTVSTNIINVNASSSTKSINVDADNSDTTLSVVSSTGVYAGMAVSGTGIPSNTTVVSTTATVITISNATTQALSNVSITFSPINGTYDSTDAGWTNGISEFSYDGIYVNQHNYWYSNGLFKIGDDTGKGVTWNGSSLSVTGVINASEGGSIAGWSIGSDEIFKGTGSSKIALNAGATPKIYIGSGVHSSAGTGFYVDSTGKFSLSDQLTFSPNVDTPEVFTTGTFTSGNNTIVVSSATGIVKGMLVIGTGIASNSTVTNISGTTITVTNNHTANGSGVSLTFSLADFSELQVQGRIKGVLESTTSISTPRLQTTATSIVIAGTVGNQIATVTTTGHAFISGEKILIENLPTTNGLNNLNREFVILSIIDSVTFTIDLSGLPELQRPTNSTNTGLTGTVTLRELTLGLHPAQGSGSYAHSNGTGIRLDKFNWWFTNNQFRVGSVDSYIKWTTDPTPLLDVVGQIRATSGYIGGISSGWKISEGIIESSIETNTIILDAGITTNNPFISIGNNTNPSFYADSEGTLNIGSGSKSLTYNPVDGVTVEGTIKAKSGFIGLDYATGWQFGVDGRLQSGEGNNTVVLVSAGSSFGGGSSTVKINRILVDNEYPETLELLGSIYLTVDLANVNSSYLSLDPEVAPGFWDKYVSFSFVDSTAGTISALLNEKRLIIQNVTNVSPFMVESELFLPDDSTITTVTSLDEIYPTYIERSGTTLVFYTTEKLAGFTGYNSSFDLAAGQIITIVSDSEDITISSLNNTTATISSIDTLPTYNAEDEVNYYKITMTTASSATLSMSGDFFDLNFYRALPSTQRTLVVYPEDLSLNVNSPNLQGYTSYTSVSTAATGALGVKTLTVTSNSGITNKMSVIGTGVDPYSKVAETPTTTTIQLSKSNIAAVSSTVTFASASISFYDSYAPGGTGTYYMWAGDQDPAQSSFSIVQSSSNSKIVVKADAGTTPVGAINMWATQNLPTGWILCNGAAITYSQYPELYVVLGGVAPYTATITVPDMRGRFPLGASQGTMPAGRLSKLLGSAPTDAYTHNHTTSIAHNHAHNISVNAHTHSDNFAVSAHNHSDNFANGGAASTTTGAGSTFLFSGVAGTYRYHTHGISGVVSDNNLTNQGGQVAGNVTTNNASNQGGNIGGSVTGQAATTTSTAAQTEILPPYFPINYIIYTGVI